MSSLSYVQDRDTILRYDSICLKYDTTILNLNYIKRFKNDTTTKFINWNYGFYKIEKIVLPKDSIYIGVYKSKYDLDSVSVYTKY